MNMNLKVYKIFINFNKNYGDGKYLPQTRIFKNLKIALDYINTKLKATDVCNVQMSVKYKINKKEEQVNE